MYAPIIVQIAPQIFPSDLCFVVSSMKIEFVFHMDHFDVINML